MKTVSVTIFLCHNSKDKNLVNKFHTYLDNKRYSLNFFKTIKVVSWLDQHRITPGDKYKINISDAITESKIILIFLSENGLGPFQIKEIFDIQKEVNKDQKNKSDKRVIPILLRGIEKYEDIKIAFDNTGEKSKEEKTEFNNINNLNNIENIEKGIQAFLQDYHWIKIKEHEFYLGKIKIKLALPFIWKSWAFRELEKAIKLACKDDLKDNITIRMPYVISGGLVLAVIGILGGISFAIPPNIPKNNKTIDPIIPSHTPEFKFVLEPRIERGGNFNNGLARVRINGKAGYIDREGNTQIPPNFDGALDFSKPDNLALAWKYGENRGFINKKGEYQIKPQYGYNRVGQFSEGKAYICHVSTCGYIDTSGNEVIKRKFTGAGQFSEGLAPVKIDGKWEYINKAGTFSIRQSFDEAYQFRESLAPVKKDNQWIYIDKDGKPIIEGKFDKISYFSEGLAAVKQNNKWGYINRQGNIVIQPQFDEPRDTRRRFDCDATDIISNKAECKHLDNKHDFSEGLAAIYMNGKWGYIDRQGNPVIQPQFSQANNFSERLAYVCQGEEQDKKCGYISHPIKTLITKTSTGFINLRGTPSIKGTLLDKIRDGSSITILNERINSVKETWYEVEANNKVGWICSDLLK